jgi:hypothetical protein
VVYFFTRPLKLAIRGVKLIAKTRVTIVNYIRHHTLVIDIPLVLLLQFLNISNRGVCKSAEVQDLNVGLYGPQNLIL